MGTERVRPLEVSEPEVVPVPDPPRWTKTARRHLVVSARLNRCLTVGERELIEAIVERALDRPAAQRLPGLGRVQIDVMDSLLGAWFTCSDLAADIGLGHAQTHRALTALETRGLVRRDRAGRGARWGLTGAGRTELDRRAVRS